MSKSKVVWIVLGSLVLVAGLVAGMMLVFQNQNIKNKAAPATSFSITPSSQNKSAGASFNFSVVLGTGENQVSGVDVVINFNPQIFQVDSVIKGSQLTDFVQIRNSIDSSAGKIYYSAYTPDSTKALNGSNLSVLTVAAQIKLGVAAGSYNFTFDASSAASGTGEGQNVLTGTTPGSLVVAASMATATPTAASTATPTGSPNGTSTPTPLPTTSGQATVTATPTSLSGGSASTPVPTQPPLPISGTSLPTVIGVIIGAFAVVGSLLLAL